MSTTLFHPGQVGMNTDCYHELFSTFDTEADFQAAMRGIMERHLSGDWGDVDKHDAKVNDTAVKTGDRIVSSYKVNGVEVWIITDPAWDGENPKVRQVTTFLRPEDY